jgi:hypothetical protein
MICQTRAHARNQQTHTSVSRLMWQLIEACLDDPAVRRAGGAFKRHAALSRLVPHLFVERTDGMYSLQEARTWFNRIATERFRLMQSPQRARALN